MSKAYVRAAAPAAAALLSACGGGGGNLNSTPPPPATPTAFPLTTSASFQAIHGDRTYRVDATGQSTTDQMGVAGRDPGVTIDYDAATGTYTVRNATSLASFGAADRTTAAGFDTYAKQLGAVTDELKLLANVGPGQSQAGAPIQLTYLSYGVWSHADAQTCERRTTYLLFGYPSTPSEMPGSGSATYTTSVAGTIADAWVTGTDVVVSDIRGSATFSADFGAGTVGTGLTLARASDQSSLGTYTGAGTINADQFSGTFSSTSGYFAGGGFAGGFFGPGANEMGYAFWLRNFNPDPYAGATVNNVNQWISGAVVGKKN
jgi:hypothetical protein